MPRRGRKAPKKDSLLAAIEARAKEMDPDNALSSLVQSKPILEAATKSLTPADTLKVEAAYVRMEVDRAMVESFPNITNSFRDIGGVEAVIGYLRASPSPEAKTVVRLWDQQMTSVRSLVPFEAYVVAAGCSRKRMLQIIIGEVSEQSNEEAALLSAVKHRDIVQKTVDVALSDEYGSGEARKMLLQHRRFLPMPKNQVIMGDVINHDNRQQNLNSQVANISVKSLEESRTRIGASTDRFNRDRISAQKEETEATDAIEAEFAEEDD